MKYILIGLLFFSCVANNSSFKTVPEGSCYKRNVYAKFGHVVGKDWKAQYNIYDKEIILYGFDAMNPLIFKEYIVENCPKINGISRFSMPLLKKK